jgi:hypothetical protein
MAFFRWYECPDCGGKFKYLHHPNDAPPPDECQLCHASMLEPEPVFVPQAPRIGTQNAQRPDQLYRQMETASEARMELMAEHGGGSASEYAHTKITNLSDSRYPGDTAAIIRPQNEVQRFMQQNQSVIGGGYSPLGVPAATAQGIEYAARTREGPFPYAGAQTSDRIRSIHASVARAVENEGRVNKK